MKQNWQFPSAKQGIQHNDQEIFWRSIAVKRASDPAPAQRAKRTQFGAAPSLLLTTADNENAA